MARKGHLQGKSYPTAVFCKTRTLLFFFCKPRTKQWHLTSGGSDVTKLWLVHSQFFGRRLAEYVDGYLEQMYDRFCHETTQIPKKLKI